MFMLCSAFFQVYCFSSPSLIICTGAFLLKEAFGLAHTYWGIFTNTDFWKNKQKKTKQWFCLSFTRKQVFSLPKTELLENFIQGLLVCLFCVSVCVFCVRWLAVLVWTFLSGLFQCAQISTLPLQGQEGSGGVFLCLIYFLVQSNIQK